MASDLVVFAFEGQFTAQNMLDDFEEMQQKGLVQIEDAVVASRAPRIDEIVVTMRSSEMGVDPTPASVSLTQLEPAVKQTRQKKSKYTWRGSGAGLLAGLLLGGPIVGLAAGAAVGAIIGSMKDYGIDDKFINEVSENLPPDSSALFLLGAGDDEEKFLAELKPYKARVIKTTLSDEQEQKLRNALSREE